VEQRTQTQTGKKRHTIISFTPYSQIKTIVIIIISITYELPLEAQQQQHSLKEQTIKKIFSIPLEKHYKNKII
jgi:hypothetical protein